jgi:AAA family ATP:ADP antiporter
MFSSTAFDRWISRVVEVRTGEGSGLLCAFGCALCMFTAYSILRPVRETMGITSGTAALPSLFWSTFACMLLLQPLYGWALSRYPRTSVLPRVYAFFALTLIAFHAWFFLQSDHTWVARAYFVWVSVFNLFVVAVFWSLMADVFSREQAGRLFGFIAAGLSTGGLIGPLLASLLAARLGSVHLLLVAAGFLLASAVLMRRVILWHFNQSSPAMRQTSEFGLALPGGAFAGFSQVVRTPYLRGVALFVVLLTSVTTVLYVDQQRVVADTIRDIDQRTVLFARIDFLVQALSLIAQLFLFSRLLKRFGFTAMLASVPVLMLLAFCAIGIGPSLEIVIGAMLLRRIGEYAVTRPCRDMLMSIVSREEKYKAKTLIDTFVYRGGDALSASAIAALPVMGASAIHTSSIAGAVLCAAWAVSAFWLGRTFDAKSGAVTARRPIGEVSLAGVNSPPRVVG